MDTESDALGGWRQPVDLQTMLDGLEIVLQPIVDLATGAAAGYEALARFAHEPQTTVDDVIAQAHRDGRGHAVEAACIRKALDRRCELPEGLQLTVNLSPDLFDHPAISDALDHDLHDVVIEMTEHVSTSPNSVREQISLLRSRGARVAVDDVGTGYAGLLRLATMRPDIVKIDRTIVTGLSSNPAQRTVLEALVTLAERMGATTIGEGIETLDDLNAVCDLDVDFGQGWAIGRPSRAVTAIEPHVAAACRRARAETLQKRKAARGTSSYVAGMHAITLALSGATGVVELRSAMIDAAREIDVDVIGVSILCADGMLREIATTGRDIDTAVYAIADFPATQRVLASGETVEAHLRDPGADPAENRVMTALGLASLLMVPLRIDGRAVGLLEFGQFAHRRWTSHDVAHGRGLANHLGQALLRVSTDYLDAKGPRPLMGLG